MDTKFSLKIVSKMGILYENEVESISTVNASGPMDVLINHEWFIFPIIETISIVDAHKKIRAWQIKNALLRVKDNQVEIFIEE